MVLDVDGTLVNSKKEISKQTLATLLKVQQIGVRLVLASGRSTFGMRSLIEKLELKNNKGFILSYNGGQVIDVENNEVLFEKRINLSALPSLEKYVRPGEQ